MSISSKLRPTHFSGVGEKFSRGRSLPAPPSYGPGCKASPPFEENCRRAKATSDDGRLNQLVTIVVKIGTVYESKFFYSPLLQHPLYPRLLFE